MLKKSFQNVWKLYEILLDRKYLINKKKIYNIIFLTSL